MRGMGRLCIALAHKEFIRVAMCSHNSTEVNEANVAEAAVYVGLVLCSHYMKQLYASKWK